MCTLLVLLEVVALFIIAIRVFCLWDVGFNFWYIELCIVVDGTEILDEVTLVHLYEGPSRKHLF